MYKPEYGDPVVTIRLPKPMISAAKMAAQKHSTTFSGLIRQLLADQLEQDGLTWQKPTEPIKGQTSIDDYQNA